MAENEKEIICVVWNLDYTIWDGILLESDNVTLKPGVVDVIKILDSRGILHSIASRNEYDLAMGKLKEFGLDEYFLYPEIHWYPQSVALGIIQRNLNINMDEILFISHLPIELKEIKNAYPEITCIDASEYLSLPDMKRLNPKFVTDDSRQRRWLYMNEIKLKQDEGYFPGTSEDFLTSLDMKFVIHEAAENDLRRAEEFIARSELMRTTDRIYKYNELDAFRVSKSHKLLICELADKYGSYGKIGLTIIEIKENHWHLRLLLMSCHVLSRGVGSILMTYIMQETKKAGKKLLADYRDTGRNRMMFVNFKFLNFKELSSDDPGNVLFENDLSTIPSFPIYVDVIAN
jgi:FkbH-like protein